MISYNKDDPQTIQEMFNSIAKNYDRTNSILSFQMHKHWNQVFIKKVLMNNRPGTILDLCCGTGDIALEYLKYIKLQNKAVPKTYMLDFSVEMLSYAQKRAEREKLNPYEINYLQADAQSLPLPDKCIDCATVAYGIRNVKEPRLCLQEVFRVLKKGGTFGILELTQPVNPLLRLGYTAYLHTVLPVMGKIFTSNKEAYNYLCNSIRSFMEPKALVQLMEAEGFGNVDNIPLMGGIATILIGKK